MRERVGTVCHLVALGAVLLAPANVLAYGEVVNGFPSASERQLLQLVNRARVDPQVELQACAGCGDRACYVRTQPLYLDEPMNRAARFYAAYLDINNVTPLAHDMAACTLATNIATAYPTTCDGASSCACSAATGSTTWQARVQAFQPAGARANPTGEVLATATGVDAAYESWMFGASAATPQCDALSPDRSALLTAVRAAGFGSYQDRTFVGDITPVGALPTTVEGQLRSGAPLRLQGNGVEFWASYTGNGGGPRTAMVIIDGSCNRMRLERGHARNGAWRFATTGYSTGCARYYFYFVDHDGNAVRLPTTGSYGIGDTSCADYEATAVTVPSCGTCAPSCAATVCGDNGCGGFCGDCPANQYCGPAGTCIDENQSRPGTSGTSSGTTSGTTSGTGVDGGSELAGGHLCGCATAERGTASAALALLVLAGAIAVRRRRP